MKTVMFICNVTVLRANVEMFGDEEFISGPSITKMKSYSPASYPNIRNKFEFEEK